MKTQDDNELPSNQRLFLAGEPELFTQSVLTGNEAEMIDILLKVDLSLNQARRFAREILANPSKFGYCVGGCLTNRND